MLRFIKDPSAGVVFDREGRIQGRGFYLCPNERCFSEAYRNRRIRNAYFGKQELMDELIQEVREDLVRLIKRDLVRCKKMGHLKDGRYTDRTIREGDLVVFCGDNPPEEKVSTHTAAPAGEAGYYHLPAGNSGCSSQRMIVSVECPIFSRLAMNLQKYGMLSSKGRA